ncbi:MAG: nuclear transport factor 2 family protein [Rhodothermales bacterium]
MGTLKNLVQKIVFIFLPSEQKEVIVTLQDYAESFMAFEPEGVLGYFDLPMTFLSDDGTVIFTSRQEIATYVSGLMHDLKEAEYARDKLSKFRINALSPNVAVTSFHLVRVNRSGESIGRFRAAYTWRKSDGAWKLVIAVLMTR